MVPAPEISAGGASQKHKNTMRVTTISEDFYLFHRVNLGMFHVEHWLRYVLKIRCIKIQVRIIYPSRLGVFV